MGSNGEAITLERGEKLTLVRKVRQFATTISPGSEKMKKKIIAGLGMQCT